MDSIFAGYSPIALHVNYSKGYVNIPPSYDPEGSAVTLIITDLTTSLTKLQYTFANSHISFSPTAFGEVGIHTVEIKLSDDGG